MRTWFRMQAAAQDATVVDIHIIDFIGDWWDDTMNRFWGEDMGVTARAFVEQLAALPESVKTIRVHINSPGGDVFGAVNIANALRAQRMEKDRRVETIVEGLAASAASIVAMAGDPVIVADNSLMMVHNPIMMAVGNAELHRKSAEDLDTIRSSIITTYQWHSTLSDQAIGALMDAETWMDADEAIAKGFATTKIEGLKAAASLRPAALAKLAVPEKFRGRVAALVRTEPPQPAPPRPAAAAAAGEVLRACREGGCLELAETLIAEHATTADVQARVSAERDRRRQAEERASAIRALCRTAKVPLTFAEACVRGGMSLADVRSQLTTITALVDGRIEIDGTLLPDDGVPPAPRIDTSEVYKALNRSQVQ